MIKLSGFLISLFLITIILLQIPEEIAGLGSFASKTDFLGSPSSAQRFLKIVTTVCILIYFGTALQLNLMMSYDDKFW